MARLCLGLGWAMDTANSLAMVNAYAWCTITALFQRAMLRGPLHYPGSVLVDRVQAVRSPYPNTSTLSSSLSPSGCPEWGLTMDRNPILSRINHGPFKDLVNPPLPHLEHRFENKSHCWDRKKLPSRRHKPRWCPSSPHQPDPTSPVSRRSLNNWTLATIELSDPILLNLCPHTLPRP